jgi:hypothetical protein
VSDNTIEYTAVLDDNANDLSILGAVEPKVHDVFAPGTSFYPTVTVRYEGLWASESAQIMVATRIHDCNRDFQYFMSATEEVISGTANVTIPDKPTPMLTSELPAGCYTATFTVSLLGGVDEIHSDDTLVVPFEVRDPSSVRLEESSELTSYVSAGLLHVTPPANIVESLAWTIFSIQGHPALNGAADLASERLSIPLDGLPSGSYIFELRGPSSGTQRTQFNYLR